MVDNSVYKLCPFSDCLTDDDIAEMTPHISHQTYTRGEHILGNENCMGVIFIKSGCLRVYMLSEEGRDITLYRLYGGDVCMLSASCVLPEITFDVFVDAEQDCDCYVIKGCVFSSLAQSNLRLKLFAYETALTRFSEVMWVVQQILFMKMDQRLAVFLWDELTRTDSDCIMLTHEQIARYISSAREVVSRMLKYFVSEKIVALERKGVSITDKQKLRELAVHGKIGRAGVT